MDERDERAPCIEVVASHEVEVDPHAVEVIVVVAGSQLVAGNAALRQAREVARLVELLAHAGVDDSSLSVIDVRVQGSSSGFFGAGSSATYTLRAKVEPLERIDGVLGAIAAHKHAQTQHLEWRYPDDEAASTACLVGASSKARAKAHALAAALGVTLGAVIHASEVAPPAPPPFPGYGAPMEFAANAAPVSPEARIARSRRVSRALRVRFAIASA